MCAPSFPAILTTMPREPSTTQTDLAITTPNFANMRTVSVAIRTVDSRTDVPDRAQPTELLRGGPGTKG